MLWREIGADGVGGESEAGSPLVDELLGVGEAGVAAGVEVGDELAGREAGGGEGFGAEGPDGGDPGKAGEFAPERGRGRARGEGFWWRRRWRCDARGRGVRGRR